MGRLQVEATLHHQPVSNVSSPVSSFTPATMNIEMPSFQSMTSTSTLISVDCIASIADLGPRQHRLCDWCCRQCHMSSDFGTHANTCDAWPTMNVGIMLVQVLPQVPKGIPQYGSAVPYINCQSSQSCLILANLLLHIRQCLRSSRPVLLCHLDSILCGCVYSVLYVGLLPALGWRGTYRAAHTHLIRPQALFLCKIHSCAPAGATLVSWSSLL